MKSYSALLLALPALGQVPASGFLFSQAPGGTLTGGTLNTVILSSCPLGVNGSDSYHNLYITGGTGASETVQIKGGTCISGGSGSVLLEPTNNHSGAWNLTNANAGLSEAISYMEGQGTVEFGAGTFNFHGVTTVPTAVTVLGQGGSATSGAATVFNCDASASPCYVRASASTSPEGTGVDSGFQLYGSGSGSGYWVGGDPNGGFAGTTWTGTSIRTYDLNVLNFSNALTVWQGDFITFNSSDFNGLALALYIPFGAGTGQTLEFYGCLLTSSASNGIGIEMDSNSYGSGPVHFSGGQVSGTITGSQVEWDSEGTHYEPNQLNVPIVSVTANFGMFFRARGGLMSVAGTGTLPAMISMCGTSCSSPSGGYYFIEVHEVWVGVTATSGTYTVTNFVDFAGTTGGGVSVGDITIGGGSNVTNLVGIYPGTYPTLKIDQPTGTYNTPNVASAAALTWPPNLNFPVSQMVEITGTTGVTSVSGLVLQQTGTFFTMGPVTFTAGATIGNTITTTPGLPYTYYYNGTQLFIK